MPIEILTLIGYATSAYSGYRALRGANWARKKWKNRRRRK